MDKEKVIKRKRPTTTINQSSRKNLATGNCFTRKDDEHELK